MLHKQTYKCKYDYCVATYGYPNEKPIVCAIHKTKDMVKLPNKQIRTCKYDCCTAMYGYPNDKPFVCAIHKTKDMVLLKIK